LRKLLKAVNHDPSFWCAEAERHLLRKLEGGCSIPLGAYAEIVNDRITLTGTVTAPDGTRQIRASASGYPDDPRAVAEVVEMELREQGAAEILAELG
jgi:hydroxymethylbilane synthase